MLFYKGDLHTDVADPKLFSLDPNRNSDPGFFYDQKYFSKISDEKKNSNS
jgi:hypothetical protein